MSDSFNLLGGQAGLQESGDLPPDEFLTIVEVSLGKPFKPRQQWSAWNPTCKERDNSNLQAPVPSCVIGENIVCALKHSRLVVASTSISRSILRVAFMSAQFRLSYSSCVRLPFAIRGVTCGTVIQELPDAFVDAKGITPYDEGATKYLRCVNTREAPKELLVGLVLMY